MDQQPRLKQPDSIVFFDGACNLCSAAVQFILKRERVRTLCFAPLQGETFRSMRYAGKDSLGDTIVLLEDGRLYSESAAVLRIARHLTLPWRWLVLPGWLFPVSVRNSLYRFIARNRYRWFGKKDACYLPSPGLAERFLP